MTHNQAVLIVTCTLLGAGLQVFARFRTAQFRTWETAPGSLLWQIDNPTGWRKVRGTVYAVVGTIIQAAGSIFALLVT
jgi:hypothetical protein